MSKKEDKNKVYFGLFIIILMVSSSVAFMYSGDSSTKKINGYKFIKTDRGWETYINQIKSNWVFNYLPNEIDFDVNDLDFGNGDINIYSENNEEYIENFKFILLYEQVIASEVDELDCNSDKITWVLNNKISNSEIVRENNCIYLNGNINKFLDGLTYEIFGVI